jgi:hypothetical protein
MLCAGEKHIGAARCPPAPRSARDRDSMGAQQDHKAIIEPTTTEQI